MSGFIFVAMTTRQYKILPFIRRRKYFVCLIFVIEGDCRKFSRNKNFPIYGRCQIQLGTDALPLVKYMYMYACLGEVCALKENTVVALPPNI